MRFPRKYTIILTMKLNVIGYGCCRGDKWSIFFEGDCDFKIVEKCSRDEQMTDHLNDVESYVFWGDGGIGEDGAENWSIRADELSQGKSITIEREEEVVVVGEDLDDCYKEFGKMELEYLRGLN